MGRSFPRKDPTRRTDDQGDEVKNARFADAFSSF